MPMATCKPRQDVNVDYDTWALYLPERIGRRITASQPFQYNFAK